MMSGSIAIFKTNVSQTQDARNILQVLSEQFPDCNFNFDLEDCDKILRAQDCTHAPEIAARLHSMGYDCKELKD